MSWFDTSSFSKYAKTALKQAQKNIDKVLDIKDSEEQINANHSSKETHSKGQSNKITSTPKTAVKNIEHDSNSFFDSFLGNTSKSSKTFNSTTKIERPTFPQNDTNKQPLKLADSNKIDSNKDLCNKNEHNITDAPEKLAAPNLPDQTADYGGKEDSLFTEISFNSEQEIEDSDKPDIEIFDDDSKFDEISFSSSVLEVTSTQEHISLEMEDNFDLTTDKNSKIYSNANVLIDNSEKNNDMVKDCHTAGTLFEKDESESSSKEHLDNAEGCNDLQKVLLHDNVNNPLYHKPLDFEKEKENTLSDEENVISEIVSDSSKDSFTPQERNEEVICQVDNRDSESGTIKNISNEVSCLKTKTDTPQFSQDEANSIDDFAVKATQGNDIFIVESNEGDETESECISEKEDTSCEKDSVDIDNRILDDKFFTSPHSDSNLDANHGDVIKEDLNNAELAIKIAEKEIDEADSSSCISDRLKVNTFTKEADVFNSSVNEPEVAGRIRQLEKEIEDLRNIVNIRESKLVELSKQNIDQQEAIAVYRSQIEQLESLNSNDDTEMEEMRIEFTKRIGETDKKLQNVIKERDQLKDLLQHTEERLTMSANEQIDALTRSLTEKENTIQGLLAEGESLSKKELEANNRIKKLRMKLKEVTGEKDSHSEKLEKSLQEITSLKENLKEKSEREEKLEAEVKKLESLTDLQEDDVSRLKDKLDDMEERYKAMESTLQNAYSEINKLNLEKAQKDSEISDVSSTIKEKEELEVQLKELEKKSKYGKEELLQQLEDLQQAYVRMEQQSARREDNLKREIADLRKRLEEGENRNQELSQSVTIATRPLLRQIENLQSSHASQADNWEKIEKSLTDRLSNLQHQVELALEKERSSTDIAIEVRSKLKVLEKQNKNLKDEKFKLQLQLEEEALKVQEIQNDWLREKAAVDGQCLKLKKLYEAVQNEKGYLEEHHTSEKARYETEIMQLNAQLLASQQHQHLYVRTNSSDSSYTSDSPNESAFKRHRRNSSRVSTSSLNESLYSDNGRSITTAASVERLQSQLRKKEGEVLMLQEETKILEKTKASLAQELVTLANNVEELENSNKSLISIKNNYDVLTLLKQAAKKLFIFAENAKQSIQKELQSRHNAVLQMYGEKAEEAEELKMDLVDIKNMYKQQIQQLLGDR